MKVYAYWDATADAPPRQAELMTLWERSWAARGWEPRLLTGNNAMKNPKYRKEPKPVRPSVMLSFALQAVKGTWICPIHVINFSLRPRDSSTPLRWREDFNRPGWKTSPLVDFGHDAAASDILHCGRALRI